MIGSKQGSFVASYMHGMSFGQNHGGSATKMDSTVRFPAVGDVLATWFSFHPSIPSVSSKGDVVHGSGQSINTFQNI